MTARWSDEVVEAAAEAISDAYGRTNRDNLTWDEVTGNLPDVAEEYRDQARAALGVIPPDPCPHLVADRTDRGPYCALADHDAGLLAAIRDIVAKWERTIEAQDSPWPDYLDPLIARDSFMEIHALLDEEGTR